MCLLDSMMCSDSTDNQVRMYLLKQCTGQRWYTLFSVQVDLKIVYKNLFTPKQFMHNPLFIHHWTTTGCIHLPYFTFWVIGYHLFPTWNHNFGRKYYSSQRQTSQADIKIGIFQHWLRVVMWLECVRWYTAVIKKCEAKNGDFHTRRVSIV